MKQTFGSGKRAAAKSASKPLAWRNAWDIPEMTAKADAAKRAELYFDLLKEHQRVSRFVIMFQEIEVLARRKNIDGFIIGPSFNDNSFKVVTK
ncbi:hypothetical protein [uncultured Hoeflea sp.]|uniref:hypothetical protein n=1 Tax=uncultured Hoeflea sp. TaxID=538666 RepID=UPI0026275BD2|nr:hypothetical protein [uncultured Hoeflea sp.]